jgi:tetratricopeptide (TPR) repeat protein
MKKAVVVLSIVVVLLLAGSMDLFSQVKNKLEGRLFSNQDEARNFKHANIFVHRGIGFFKKQKFSQAEEQLLKGIKVFPKFADGHFYLAKIYLKGKEYQKALKYSEMALKYRGYMHDLYTRSRAITEGYNSLTDKDEQIKRDRKHADYLFHKGTALFRLKKTKEAELTYITCLKLNIEHTQCLNNLLAMYFSVNQIYKAVKIMEYLDLIKLKINQKLVEAVANKAVSLAETLIQKKNFGNGYVIVEVLKKYNKKISPKALDSLTKYLKEVEGSLADKYAKLKSSLNNGTIEKNNQEILKLIRKAEFELISIYKPDTEKRILNEFNIHYLDLVLSY